ncbi:MAG: aminotransferase class III-fold pyridoxal phosphate-dependent enzyme, partial [Hyphomicrobiaceae bacterium]
MGSLKSRHGRRGPRALDSHGQGALAWDIDGNEYVDLVSALLPTILGARDPDVDAAIRRQLCSGVSLSLATELEAQLAETLCRLIPCAEAVRFGKTGTDVTTAASRAARAFTGRDRVLICGGYHGWADWSVERNLGVPEDVRKLTTRVPFGKFKAWDVGDYAAVIVEPYTPHVPHVRQAARGHIRHVGIEMRGADQPAVFFAKDGSPVQATQPVYEGIL